MAKDNINISVEAEWDFEESAKKLNKGLKKIEKRLNALSIKAKLDEKTNTELQNLIQKLNKVKKLANQIEKKGIKLNTQSDNSIDKTVSKLQKAGQAINDLNNKSIDVDTKKAENNIDNLNDSLKGVENSVDGAGKSLKEMLKDIGISMGTREALEAIKRTLNDITDAVKEYDQYSTNLKIITGGSESEVDDLISEYTEKSIEMKVDVSEYEQAAETILRTGQSIADADKLIEDSIILGKTGYISTDKAAENLVTIKNSYDLTADAIQSVNDKLLKLDSSSNTTAGNLSTAIADSAKNAQLAGTSIDSLAAQIANLKDVTGKTEGEIATSLNSIYSRVYNVKLGNFIEEDSGEDISKDLSDTEKILNKVNISLRDSKDTFRNFDDILADLAANWKSFSEVEQSAIATTIGGKAHRGVVLSMIEDFDGYQKLYETSINSAGTAAEKYSAYMDSLEAKSNSLNTALKQMFSNTIDSDFIGGIKEASTEVVQFIDKYEILQNLLKTATIYAVAKGFITLKSSLADTWKSLSNLSNAFNSLSTFQNTTAGTTAYNTALSSLGGSMSLLTENQTKLLLSTNGLTESQRIAILEASGMSMEEAKVSLSTMGLATAENTATTATFSLSGAFKALTMAIKANPIGAIVTGLMTVLTIFSAVKNKVKQAEEEQEERRQAAIESSKATEEEIKSIHDLTEQYVKLVSSTNDITTVKGELSSIQDEIIDKYGKEADGIDIVNGKLSENIKKMRELEVEENKQWLRDNNQAVKDAKKFIQNPSTHGGGATSFVVADSSLEDYEYEHKETAAKIYQKQLKKYLEESGTIDFFNISDSQLDLWDGSNGFSISFDLVDGLSIEESKKALAAYLDAYEKLYNFVESKFSDDPFDLEQRIIDLKPYVEKYIESVDMVLDAESRQAQIDASEFFNTAEGRKIEAEYKELIDEANRLSQEINNPENTPGAVYSKQLDLEKLRDDIVALTANFPILSDEAERAFNNMGLNIDGTIASTDNLRESFYETLDEMQKGTLANVDTIEKAMKTMADGGELEHMEVWNIMQLDKDKITQSYYDENAKKLKMDYEDLVKLKDHLIQQEQEQLRLGVQEAEQARRNAQKELAVLDGKNHEKPKGNTKPSEEWITNQAKQAELRKQIAEWGDEIQRNELLIKDLNSSLGDTIAAEEKIKKIQKDINNLQEQADNYEKAFTQKIDNVIDSLESEKDILNDELDSLNDQLDALEKQKDELDEIIDNYKQVANIVSDAVDNEKELLEEQRKSQEDAYNERINALKEAYEQQEEENELTEKQIALQEKLQALDKAKQNKVMTYSSERGWHYDVDKEELLAAQKDADNAQKDIDDTLAERAYEAEIKAIEDERDSILENYDLQIEAYENYIKEWKELLEEQTNAENERLAQEILGSDWREKIKEKDAQILNNYKSEFRNYNSQLSSLVNGEMANLKQSIEIKNEEIKAKQELIDQWKDYKSEVQNAINSIKNANEDYMQYLGSIALDENSNFEAREANLANFTQIYKSYIDEIIEKSSELEEANNRITESMASLSEIQLSVDSAADAASEAIRNALDTIAKMTLFNKFKGLGGFFYDALGSLPGYSAGGTADYTGLAMLHGTKSKPELILNNADAAKLYNIIHDSSFTDMMMEKQYGHLIRSIPVNNNSSTSNSININHMEVKANDPIQFHEQFQKELKQHYRFALSESLVN